LKLVTQRKPFRILVVDDHAIVRAGICAILNGHVDLQVTAEAESAPDAIRLVGSQRFDAIVLDLNMPAGSGWEFLRSLRAGVAGATPILVLSAHSEEEYAIQALRHGAAGYLSKDRAPQELVQAVLRVAAGGRFIGEKVASRLADVVLGSESPLAPRVGSIPGACVRQEPCRNRP
jgi:two-component system, NarL family, invasion response regulator UvrY